MPRPPGTFWSSFTVIERDSNNKATKVKCKFVLFFGAIILIVATGMPIVPMLLGEMGFWPMKQEWSSIWKLIKSKKMTTSPPSLQSTSMAVFFSSSFIWPHVYQLNSAWNWSFPRSATTHWQEAQGATNFGILGPKVSKCGAKLRAKRSSSDGCNESLAIQFARTPSNLEVCRLLNRVSSFFWGVLLGSTKHCDLISNRSQGTCLKSTLKF